MTSQAIKNTDKAWLKTRNKIATGHCASGFHEGTKPRDMAGNPAQVCHWWDRCPCNCHYELDQLFEQMGRERIFMPNSDYVTPDSPYVMPDPFAVLEQRVASFSNGDSDAPPVLARPLEAGQVAVEGHVFSPTESGRLGRGQLEYTVLAKVKSYEGDEVLTPQFVARLVDPVDPPSNGAVDAVFKRWADLGFATVEKKPTRLTGFTGDNSAKALDRIKAETKRKKKLSKLEVRRNSIHGTRPRV